MLSVVTSNTTEEDHERRRVRPKLEYQEPQSFGAENQTSYIETHYEPSLSRSLSKRALAIPEVLLLILSWFTYSDLSTVSFTRIAPVAVSQVSRQWRTVALSMPSLWANFGIMLSGSPGRFGALRTTSGDVVNLTLVARWWQRFLDRSRNADLSIVIGSWANTGYSCSARDYRSIRSILNETLKHRSRLVRLQVGTLFFPPSDCVQKNLDIKDMAKIKWLKVVGSHNVTVYVDQKSMPNLTTLDYDGAVQFPLQIQTLPTQLLTLSVVFSQANNVFSWQWTIFKNILLLSPLLRKLDAAMPFDHFPYLQFELCLEDNTSSTYSNHSSQLNSSKLRLHRPSTIAVSQWKAYFTVLQNAYNLSRVVRVKHCNRGTQKKI